jgi:hypothetical protein
MIRNILVSFLLAIFITVPLLGDQDYSDLFVQLEKKQAKPHITGQIRYLIQKAKSAGLYLPGFYGRIREGILRDVDCGLILHVIRKEYELQSKAFAILQQAACFTQQSHRVLTSLLYLKLSPFVVSELVAVYKKDCRLIFLGSAGNFISYMKKIGWKDNLLLPLGKLIISSQLSSDSIKKIKQLLLYGRDLRLKQSMAIGIVVKGFQKGDSLRRIRHQLQENKNFQ